MLRFRIFGVPFVVTGYFWIGCVLLGGIGSGIDTNRAILKLAIWVVCVFVSIVVHEMGHALAGRRFGAFPEVVLHGIGGMTYLPSRQFTRLQSILVSLAGPAAGLALWFLVRLTYPVLVRDVVTLADPVMFAVVLAASNLLFINLVWTLFNLLPILPLDGGQVLRETLGPRWIGVTRIIGGVTAAVLAALCAKSGEIYLTIFLGYLAYLNFKGNPRQLPGGVSR